jgi:hypothetical protein
LEKPRNGQNTYSSGRYRKEVFWRRWQRLKKKEESGRKNMVEKRKEILTALNTKIIDLLKKIKAILHNKNSLFGCIFIA